MTITAIVNQIVVEAVNSTVTCSPVVREKEIIEVGNVKLFQSGDATQEVTEHINDTSIHTIYDANDWAAFELTLQGL